MNVKAPAAPEAAETFDLAAVAASMLVAPTGAAPAEVKKKGENAPDTKSTPALAEEDGSTDEGDSGNTDDGAVTEDGTDDDPFADTQEGDEGADPDAEQADEDDGEEAKTYTVTVDGEKVQVTLSQLLRSYSGEGAIDKRLQEATELRNTIKAEKAKIDVEFAEATASLKADRANLAKAMQVLEGMVLVPRVKQPDTALQKTDPARYLLEMENFRADQSRLQRTKAGMDAALAAHQRAEDEQLTAYKQAEAKKLLDAIPALKDPKRSPQVQALIVNTAKAAGFSEREIGMAADHRIYMMVLKAGLYDKIMAQKGTTAKVVTAATVTGAKTARTAVTSEAKRRKATVSRAQETGSVADVAATMLVSKPRR